MNKDLLIESLLETIRDQEKTIDLLLARINVLEANIAVSKNIKNSSNSHPPPSKDENRPLRNQSLREKSGRKAGGQPGHEGTTLKCSTTVDTVVSHIPDHCNCCGKDLAGLPEILIDTRQVIDIPVIKPVCIAHKTYRKTCSCGHVVESDFPAHVTAPVQYGPNVESLVGYLHARQYLPYHRMKELFADVMGLPLSVGGINNVLKRLTQKALPHYEQIKERVYSAAFLGTDETGVKVNGQKNWMWTWQNSDVTYIVHSDNRGFKTIEDQFGNGLPNATLQHDRFACHFKCKAGHHQVCTAHLLRDIQYLQELYGDKCAWAGEMKALLMQSLQLKQKLTATGDYTENKERQILTIKLDALLNLSLDKNHGKAKTLQKSLRKHQSYILHFLHDPEVPPDNNSSERAIRNVKVKQKVSGQFKSEAGANAFAILRSIIDTTIKSGQNVLNALSLIARLATE